MKQDKKWKRILNYFQDTTFVFLLTFNQCCGTARQGTAQHGKFI
jgi:hypothetical protein